MKTILIIGGILLPMVCIVFLKDPEARNLSLDTEHAVQYANLRLYPILASSSHSDLNYLSLEEAMTLNKVKVMEMKNLTSNEDESTVNTLFIENLSADSVLVLGGEVVEGGNQNRMIAQDFILPPHSGKVDVSVFCVEKDRWNGDSDQLMVMNELAPNDVRKVALDEKDQARVLEAVDEKIHVNLDVPVSSSVTEVMNDSTYQAHIMAYVNHLENKLPNEVKVVGVMAVSGGEVIGSDCFGSHNLFVKYFPRLLKAYAGEALATTTSLNFTHHQAEQYFENLIVEKTTVNKSSLRIGNRTIHETGF